VRGNPNPETVRTTFAGDVGVDETVLAGAKDHKKGYMMGKRMII
jgi:hypothetical protein